MHKGRLEAFSDCVLSIIITVMVLNLRVPLRATGFADLKPVLPSFLCYVLSFVYLAIYWNNHHHMFQATRGVTGSILWANMHLLFWLSLVPFVTGWMAENHFEVAPTALYGLNLLMAAFAYWILQWTILHAPGGNPTLAAAVGRDFKGKASLALYVMAIFSTYANPWIARGIYVLVAMIWLVPDRRIEHVVLAKEPHEK